MRIKIRPVRWWRDDVTRYVPRRNPDPMELWVTPPTEVMRQLKHHELAFIEPMEFITLPARPHVKPDGIESDIRDNVQYEIDRRLRRHRSHAELTILEGGRRSFGNATMLSCEIEFDRDRGQWKATMLEGATAWADRKDAAVLLCFAEHLGIKLEIRPEE